MLTIQNLSVYIDQQPILNDINLTVNRGEIVCLLGASGSGKTTLLRAVAGLQAHQKGRIAYDGVDLQPIAVHRRQFALMFQDHALFPHLSVAENIAFGLKMRGVNHHQRQQRVEELLARVKLADYVDRDIHTLSGGERQRVALARSLAANPRLLMLDEPLAALDANLREQLQLDLRHIVKSLQIPTLYVTHDQSEAFALADKIVILRQGELIQQATPQMLYERPATRYVAQFLGFQNIFYKDKLPSALQTAVIHADWVLLHPSGIAMQPLPDAPHDAYHLSITIQQTTYRGGRYDVIGQTDEGAMLHFSSTTQPQNGTRVALVVRANAMIALQA